MKNICKIIPYLCLVLALLAIATACSPNTVKLPEGAEAYKAELETFVKDNQAVMTTIAEKLLADGDYAYHAYYATTSVGNKTSEVYTYVLKDGSNDYEKVPCTDKDLLALCETTFTGDVTHGKDAPIVSFRPTEQLSGITYFMVYSKGDNAQTYLKKDFLPDARNVTVTPIEGNWYLVMA